jgi:hypothetical protein
LRLETGHGQQIRHHNVRAVAISRDTVACFAFWFLSCSCLGRFFMSTELMLLALADGVSYAALLFMV